jgi:hypothetical protein
MWKIGCSAVGIMISASYYCRPIIDIKCDPDSRYISVYNKGFLPIKINDIKIHIAKKDIKNDEKKWGPKTSWSSKITSCDKKKYNKDEKVILTRNSSKIINQLPIDVPYIRCRVEGSTREASLFGRIFPIKIAEERVIYIENTESNSDLFFKEYTHYIGFWRFRMGESRNKKMN